MPPIPEGAAHIWGWWNELSRVRGGNGFGPNPITPTAVLDWARLMGRTVRPWEAQALFEIDRLWFRQQAEDQPRQGG